MGPKYIADMYGKAQDLSQIIYVAMPDFDANNPTHQQEYMYPKLGTFSCFKRNLLECGDFVFER